MDQLQLRELVKILVKFSIPYKLGMSEQEMKDAIYNRILENPDVTGIDIEALKWLQDQGYMLVDENAQQIKL